jgi:hypothetical protein
MIVTKYAVPDKSHFKLCLPAGAKILTVQVLNELLRVFILVNPDNLPEKRSFRNAETGEEISESENELAYIGSFQAKTGRPFHHIFEIIKS